MSQEQEQITSQYAASANALENLVDRISLSRDERHAAERALDIFAAIARNPQSAQPLLEEINRHEAGIREDSARRRAAVIWSRVDKTVKVAVKTTFDLGRVSQDVIDAATALARCAQEAIPHLVDHLEGQPYMDRIEAVSHQLRTAARSLSGSTQSVLKVDHALLGKALKQWTPISSAAALLGRFDDLGLAWEPPLELKQARIPQRMSTRRA